MGKQWQEANPKRRGYGVKFWDVPMLANYLGVPKTWVYDRTRENGPELIPCSKFGKYVRFNPESEAFRRWLEAHEVSIAVGSPTQRTLQAVDNTRPKSPLPQVLPQKH